MAKRSKKAAVVPHELGYDELLIGISDLLERARRMSARSVNSILTTTYWEIGRRVVEFEQGGKARAEYGEGLWKRLAADLTAKYGRGFSKSNLASMRGFYQGWEIFQTPSGKSEAHVRFVESNASVGGILQMPSGKSLEPDQTPIASQDSPLSLVVRPPSETPTAAYPGVFPLAWSHYVQLMSVTTARARAFYEAEAIRGGWSVRQLDRQISTQFYERTSHSKRRAAMLAKGQIAKPEDATTVEDEVRDPYLLEFLNLKDEYSESELEDALIRHLEWFLLELGAGFTFVARQKRIRVGDTWYRIDLLLYHRGLRCLVIIDLKTGAFTYADAGQMNLYLNYAKRHLMLPDEADPVGIILC